MSDELGRDFTREDLARIRAVVTERHEAASAYVADPSSAAAATRLDTANAAREIAADQSFEILLSMAERSVSVETVQKLAQAIELDDERFDAANGGIHYEAARLSKDSRAAMADFYRRATADLRAAATLRGSDDV